MWLLVSGSGLTEHKATNQTPLPMTKYGKNNQVSTDVGVTNQSQQLVTFNQTVVHFVSSGIKTFSAKGCQRIKVSILLTLKYVTQHLIPFADLKWLRSAR